MPFLLLTTPEIFILMFVLGMRYFTCLENCVLKNYPNFNDVNVVSMDVILLRCVVFQNKFN